jgi:hypothetical protein
LHKLSKIERKIKDCLLGARRKGLPGGELADTSAFVGPLFELTNAQLKQMKQFFYAFAMTAILTSCSTLANLPGATSVTEAEAAQGIREALDKGIDRGVALLNKQDGFLGSAAYKIFIPQEAVKIENTLRQLGMG